jgi:hypothetical protein
METYTLVALVALFVGVMAVVLLLDRRRRTEQAHFDQLDRTLAGCLDALRNLHTGNETQSAQLVGALNQLRAAVETGTNSATESSRTLSKDSVRAIEQAATHLEAAVLAHQKAVDTTLVRAADKLSESAAARSKELLAEAQRTTKAVEALEFSLKESVKFDTKP